LRFQSRSKRRSAKKKAPSFDGTFRQWPIYPRQLAVARLLGVLPLAVRILLLLSGFLATALLLAGLLTRILILLARILVLIGHQDLHSLNVAQFPRQVFPKTGAKNTSVQAGQSASRAVAAVGFQLLEK